MKVFPSIASEWLRRLQQSESVTQAVILFNIFILHVYKPMKRTYEQRYGTLQSRQLPVSTRPLPRTDNDMLRGDWSWRGIPKLWPILDYARTLSSLAMLYVILRDTYPPLSHNFVSLLNLSMPAHCYLVGRFVLHPKVSQMIGLLFSFYHIGWRCVQEFAGQSMVVSTIYFMLLDEHEIQQYAKLLAASNEQSRRNTTQQRRPSRLSGAELSRRFAEFQEGQQPGDGGFNFMHDIMSFKVEFAHGSLHKLRPNRTLECRQRLQSYFMVVSLVWAFILLVLSTSISTAIILYVLNVRNYLYEYPNCSPEVEQLAADEDLPEWSVNYLTIHQYVTYLADTGLNIVLWFEGGFVAVVFMTMITLLNYDLRLYWRQIDVRITAILRLMIAEDLERDENSNVAGSSRWANQRARVLTADDQKCPLSGQIFELQMQVQDFIKQVGETNKLFTDCYAVILTIWFTTFAYTSYWQFNGGLPKIIILLVAVLLSVVTFTGAIILTVQRDCARSYTRLCSVMAHDRSRNKRNFIRIVEYYLRNRTCFTVYRGYTLRSTTLLTLIGYSFSCFFIVGSMCYR